MIQQTLFGETDTGRPLASRMRPRTLEEFAGQRHLLGEGKVLRQLIDGDRVPSMVFWGPPGVGKTTLARIIANRTKANFRRPRGTAASANRPSCSWTRSTASTKRSRMRFCPLWKREASSSSAPPRKTLRSRSTRRFCPGARCLCCTVFRPGSLRSCCAGR